MKKTMIQDAACIGTALALCCLAACASADTAVWPAVRPPLAFSPDPMATSTATFQAETTDQLIVKFRDTRAPQVSVAGAAISRTAEARWTSALAIARLYGVQKITYVRSLAIQADVMRLDRPLPMVQAEALAHDISAADPAVQYAQADRPARLQAKALPDDPYFLNLPVGETIFIYNHYIDRKFTFVGINAAKAWEESTGAGIVVAVVDSGVLPHPDLVGNLLSGYDFVSDARGNGDGDGRDGNAGDPGSYYEGACGGAAPPLSDWHGTRVAGIIGAVANNRMGVAGIAYDAKLLPVRVVGRCLRDIRESDILDGLVWASGRAVPGVPPNPNPARVINASLGVGSDGACGRAMQEAIDVVRANNAVVVVAAGNDNADAAMRAPANCDGVIAVGAISADDGVRAPNSNFGAKVSVAAPVAWLTTSNLGRVVPGDYDYSSAEHTSYAAPVVAGVAALMLSRNPKLTPEEVKALLQRTAQPFPTPCNDKCPGVGIVDAAAAVEAVLPSPGTSRPSLLKYGDIAGAAENSIVLCAGFDRATQALKADLFCNRLIANKDTYLRYVKADQSILNVDGRCLTRADEVGTPLTFELCVAGNPNQRFGFHFSFGGRYEWKALVPKAGIVTGYEVRGLGETCISAETLSLCRASYWGSAAPPPITGNITLMEVP